MELKLICNQNQNKNQYNLLKKNPFPESFSIGNFSGLV